MRHRKPRPAFTDGVIDLYPIDLGEPDPGLGFGDTFDFLVAPHGVRAEAGQISIRLGESPAIAYFGHIGYHIDPPYRGHGWAERACRLLLPVMHRAGKEKVLITADPTNAASRRTCEKLGAVLLDIVPVPPDMQRRWQLSAVKCRYVVEGEATTAFPDLIAID